MAKPGTTPTQGGLVQMAFRVGTTGFTESWAWPGNTDLSSLSTRAIQLVKERAKLMGYGVVFTAVRVSLLPRRGSSKWVDVFGLNVTHQDQDLNPYTSPWPGGVPVDDQSDYDTDLASSSILAQYLNFSNSRRKVTWHSGIPDRAIRFRTTGSPTPVDANWYDAWLGWLEYIVTAGWGWIGRATTPRKQILRWGTNPDISLPNFTFTVSNADAAFVDGDLVLITGVSMHTKGQTTPNGGPYQVYTHDVVGGATTYTIICVPEFGLTNLCKQGYAREYSLTVFPVEDAVLLKGGSHKRGRPFDLSRGRRQTRRLLL